MRTDLIAKGPSKEKKNMNKVGKKREERRGEK
jgi:hypothetical protein